MFFVEHPSAAVCSSHFDDMTHFPAFWELFAFLQAQAAWTQYEHEHKKRSYIIKSQNIKKRDGFSTEARLAQRSNYCQRPGSKYEVHMMGFTNIVLALFLMHHNKKEL